MDIIYLGHCIKKGKYVLHSKFKNVINYTNDKELVSIVSENIGKGPNNIILTRLPQFARKTINISENTLYIGNTALKIYPDETLKTENIFLNNKSHLKKKIELLLNCITDKIPTKSLGFLLFPKNESFFVSNFEKALLNHVKQTVQNVTLENLPAITKNMKGIGFGLTPSGDDFNCGVLYALNYLNWYNQNQVINKSLFKQKKDTLKNIREECYSNSIGNNIISNTFLKYAYINQYYENFYKLLKALKQNDKKKLLTYSEKVINTGHSSGSDMITGFILTIKGVLNDQKSG